jgi:hypothetical protein
MAGYWTMSAALRGEAWVWKSPFKTGGETRQFFRLGSLMRPISSLDVLPVAAQHFALARRDIDSVPNG